MLTRGTDCESEVGTVAYVLSLARTRLCPCKEKPLLCAKERERERGRNEREEPRRKRQSWRCAQAEEEGANGSVRRKERMSRASCLRRVKGALTCWLHYKHFAAKAASERLPYCCYYLTATCYYYLWRGGFVSASRGLFPQLKHANAQLLEVKIVLMRGDASQLAGACASCV